MNTELINEMKSLKCVALILCAAAILLNAGCSSDPTHGKKPDPAAITAQVQKEMKFPEMLEIKADRLSKYYTMPSGSVDSFSLYLCSSAASADEIAVFKAKTNEDAAKIKTAVQARIDQKSGVFQNYGKPTEYSDIQSCVLETKGPYVLFAVTDDNTKAKSIIDGFFK